MQRLSLLKIYTALQEHGTAPLANISKDLSEGLSVGNTLIDLLNSGSVATLENADAYDGAPVPFSLGLSHLEAITAINKWKFIDDILTGLTTWLTHCSYLTNDDLVAKYVQNLSRKSDDDGDDDIDSKNASKDQDHICYANLDLDYLENIRNQMQIISLSLENVAPAPVQKESIKEKINAAVRQIDSLRERITFRATIQNQMNEAIQPPMLGDDGIGSIIWNFLLDDESALAFLKPAKAGPSSEKQEDEEKKED